MSVDREAEARARQSQAGALLHSLGGCWAFLVAELEYRRAPLVQALIAENSEELRGRIKEIDDLLRLPHALQQELRLIKDSLPE